MMVQDHRFVIAIKRLTPLQRAMPQGDKRLEVKMKVPKYIQAKMHRLASISADAAALSKEIDDWFISRGFVIEDLRSGDGLSLEELEYGNDITEVFCERIECEEFERNRLPRTY